jgi:outer membrane protein assembly factor BamB
MLMLRISLTAVFIGFTLTVGAAITTTESAAAPQVSHRVIVQGKDRIAIVNAKGEVEWEVPCAFTSHDIAVLPNGHYLLHTGPATIVEMTPDKKVAWQYVSQPKAGYSGPVEIHAFQRLQDGLTMIAESGNQRIIEVDKDGRIVRQIPLTVDHPNPHRDTRLARKLENGHYLVCHEGDGVVREYDETGKVVWSYALDLNGREETPGHDGHGTNVFGAIRLPNGDTLIAGGNNNRVLEVTPAGKIVWSVDHNELPGIRLYWVTTLEMLPNGHLVIGNTHAGPDNPQLIEITRDKKVVWTFRNFEAFGNDVAAAEVLDAKGPVLR